MRKEIISSLAVISLLVGVPSLQASTSNSKKQSIKNELQYQNKTFKVASKEIRKGLSYTLKAIDALQKNDAKKASKLLEEATKNFDKALKLDPKLGLVPVEEEVVAYEYKGSLKDIKNATKIAKDMIDKHNLQFARDLLAPLKDEIDITTHYLPMDLYPNSTKMAQKLLKKNKIKKALLELNLGLSTIVTQQAVIPIPLLVASDTVKLASNLDKKNKKDALILLNKAQEELSKALLLGYTSNHSAEYKSLSAKIEAIKKEIKGKNEVEKLYQDIKKDFKSLLNKTRKEKTDKDSVWNNTKKEHLKALEEEEKDKMNFMEKEKSDLF